MNIKSYEDIMSLAYFVNPCDLKLCILKGDVAKEENIAKRKSLEWLNLTPLGTKFQFLWLVSLPNQYASRMYEISPADTEPPQKHEWVPFKKYVRSKYPIKTIDFYRRFKIYVNSSLFYVLLRNTVVA